jgi:2-polyprenyl-6-methoxyphenol hydroxylase-like FAD-dependent oxidoreductase
VAGLATALGLARDGHEIDLFEADPASLTDDPLQAFEAWTRKGAPQVWHSHAFLARLRNLLRDEVPDFHRALLERGAYEVRFGENLPPTLTDFRAEPGDEDLTLLACRRITFEWVLRSIVEQEPRVRWHGRARVTGLEGALQGGLVRVAGVRVLTEAGERTNPAELVVDASGRRSALVSWLRELGTKPPEVEQEDCGIFYCSRFYRLREGAAPPAGATLIGSDLGYMKYAIFPGDAGIFSVTLAASPEDRPLRRILRARAFEAAARAIPVLAEWIDEERSRPASPVRGMRSLRNRRLRLVREQRPLVLGVYAVGDAAIHTNPLYGRGCTLAFVHAWLLRQALREHPGDAEARALAFHEATERELGPWYVAAREQDRDARRVAEAWRRGEDPDAAPRPDQPVDPRAFMRSVLRDGLLPALRTDAVVLRTFARTFNLLAAPDALVTDPDVLQRILAAWREKDSREAPAPPGPGRDEMVELLERVA